MYSIMAMYSEPTTENFNKIKQTLEEREKEVLNYIHIYLKIKYCHKKKMKKKRLK